MMYCSQCGKKVVDQSARFCSKCGFKLPDFTAEKQKQECHIVCVHLGEKWSVFGKDLFEFRAVCGNAADGEVIAQSEEFTVTGFDYAGPKADNKHHRNAFEKLVRNLELQKWMRSSEKGPAWYEAAFSREKEE
jgi:hypothetical protein